MASVNDQLDELLTEYIEEFGDDVSDVFKKVGKDTVKNLKNTSPKKTGEYASGWTYEVSGNGVKSELLIYNRKKPGLTHLLEKGHAKRGGRVAGIRHIESAEQKAENEIVERLSK